MAHYSSLQNSDQPQLSPLKVKICDDFGSRLLGYMFTPTISATDGLILQYSHESIVDTSIHMFFMNFDLGVFWLDKDGRIVDKALAIKWKPYYASKVPAQSVLEAHPGLLDQYQIHDRLVFKHA